ncbi:MAG: hypothetical protein AAF479_01375 [Pseudomonadota bacterium]
MHIHTSFLANRFWLWTGIGISLLSVAAYAYHAPPHGRDGSTMVGYVLGGFSGLIVLYLAWLGVRKRRFATSRGNRRDVVSAHVFLGLSLIVTATLHTGFEFALSIHTLTYVLLLLVIGSGIFGVSVYAGLPETMSRNLNEMIVEKKNFDWSALEQLEWDLRELDRRLGRALQFLPDSVREPVQGAIENTRIGGGLFRILSGSSRGCATDAAIKRLRGLVDGGGFSDAERTRLGEVMRDLARKRQICACLRRDTRYRALLKVWLWLHVPLTSALIVALISHVVLVFFYW